MKKRWKRRGFDFMNISVNEIKNGRLGCPVKFFIFASLLFLCISASHTEEIILPDMETVVSGNEVLTVKDALPDFSDVIVDENTASGNFVRLPDYPLREDPLTETAGEKTKEKDIFVEGLVGGGYPEFFTGDFSVYRSSGENPFSLGFFHESSAGYSRKDASDGFFDEMTKIYGDKTFTLPSSVWKFSGSYEKNGNGMQNVSPVFYDVSKRNLGGRVEAGFHPSDIFELTFSAGASWYGRYAGKKNSSSVSAPEEGASIFLLDPFVRASWEIGQVKLKVLADYKQQNNIAGDENITSSEFDAQAAHRGRLGADISWSNGIFTVFEEVSAVAGTAIGSDRKIIVPFTLGFEIKAEPSFMSGPFVFSAQGGISSVQETYSMLEKKYGFAVLNFIPPETTDWYAYVRTAFPVNANLTFNGSAEYRKTAFGNGVWQPDYERALPSGMYGFTETERELLKTKADISFYAGIFTFSALWTAEWKDIPVLESRHLAEFAASVQSSDARTGADLSLGFEAGEGADKTPVIDFASFVRFTSAVRIAVQVDDIVKLAAGRLRTYAGKYGARSGSAALLVKFFF
ncbi:hypothetical protein HRI96_09235 [Treponema parvum]|uniref:Uncharacterized protein n=1 Tax=Treponema parvum TaxID=138851 RepID=A0A975F0I6_9SPIR|nr:hypothetical protein [Treponema parvum]QTQ12365.1 hypothetical protein HRI96_09235 [Treponema parvum]